MKLTIKELNEKIIPAIQKLDLQNEKVKASVQELYDQINAQNKTNGVVELSAKIEESQEELRAIELKKGIRQLKQAIEAKELEVNPIAADFDFNYDGLRDVFFKPEKDLKIVK